MTWSARTQLNPRKVFRALRRASTAVGAPWARPAPFAADLAGLGITEVAEFGSNPGRLRMGLHVPSPAPAPGAPLVVVLHGCGQSGGDFAREAGWIALSERLRLPLLLPEQSGDNNPNGCFNWFRPIDVTRGRGEVLSIRQMAAEAVRRFRSDPRQVFVVGLSAGGALAAALLAAYPDVFAAGAAVAGLPVGCARTPAQAYGCMADGGPERTPLEWAARARAVGPARFRGPWPRISIWHGAQDRTVDRRNADNLVAQWTALHGFEGAAEQVSAPFPGATRSVWGGARPAVEYWMLDTLLHAFPAAPAPAVTAALDPDPLASWAIGPFGRGFPLAGSQGGRWVHDVGVDATAAIARFWQLL